MCRCQLISNSTASCRDLAGRNTMYAYPPIAITVSDLFIETIVSVLEEAEVSDECIDLYVHLSCLAEPPCNPQTNLPVLICEESCKIFQQIRTEGFCKQVDEVVLRFSTGSSASMIESYLNLDCTNSSTYFLEKITQPDPTICTNLFAPEVRGKCKNWSVQACILKTGSMQIT